ncbi:heavy-metal-associated domain-containing protein [Cognatitamlana onchidii]|uniref:heavy-metal-associated domain-containing protein n=1 Tax=Cognatitamlana onchidii TaxID=2562860 RepID=UPI0010A60584|nr:heavy metal-associated domain-containing protein [Algibacter onchidii]
MKHIYTVTGMTCNNCRVSVEEVLNNVPDVKMASVNLERAEAIIEMDNHIPILTLQKALSNKYTIAVAKKDLSTSSLMSQEDSLVKQLFPLFLIFAYISCTALLLNFKTWNVSSFMLDFMGLFFIVFSFFKFLDLKGFTNSFRMYDPIAKQVPLYAWVYPFLELVLGLMFLIRIQIDSALALTLVLLGVTTVGVIKVLLKKQTIQCACLGTVLKLPMTKATFIENTIMIVMALFMLIKSFN